MVINEKALVSRMKDAYKTYGYTVAVEEDRMYLSNGFWLAEINTDNVPGEILGMFGEHIRDIPKNGDAYKVIKDKTGPIVQKRILEDALGAVKSMYSQREKAYEGILPVQMRKTNLTYDGCRVWQAACVGDIYMIDPRYAAMIANTKDVVQVGEGIYAEGETSKLWILRVNKKEDKVYVEHLQQIAWVTE
ncbi:MAG: hypothetical protein IJF02_05525 [Oscillospiraceae bacterium]|nr:hypothetical protein [Oscillospiraceae bacterium]